MAGLQALQEDQAAPACLPCCAGRLHVHTADDLFVGNCQEARPLGVTQSWISIQPPFVG